MSREERLKDSTLRDQIEREFGWTRRILRSLVLQPLDARLDCDEALRRLERIKTLVDEWTALHLQLAQVRSCPLNQVLSELEPALDRISGSGRTLVIRTDPEIGLVAVCRRMLQAVVLHAVEATGAVASNGGTIAIRTASMTRDSGAKYARLEIAADAGRLLPGDARWQLLDEREADPVSPMAAIAQGIRDSGGAIQLETELAQRTRVVLDLPLGEAPRPACWYEEP